MKTLSLLLALLVLPFSGCAAVVSALPSVLAYATDGMLIVSTIESFVNDFFRVKPNPALQKDISQAIARTKTALDALVRMASGTQKLDQARYDEAFNEFKLAYLDLMTLAGPLGVSMGDRLQAAPGRLIVPEPLAFRQGR